MTMDGNERNEYVVAPDRPLRVVPDVVPPSTPVRAGLDLVDELEHVGHRWRLLFDPDSGRFVIEVDGLEIWDDEVTEAQAARELADRLAAARSDLADEPDADRTEASDDVAVDDDVPGALVRVEAGSGAFSVERRPLLEDWQRSPAAARAALGSLLSDWVFRLSYRVMHPFKTLGPLAALWGRGSWWLALRWWQWTTDTSPAAKAAEEKALRVGVGPGDRNSDKAALEWRQDHRQVARTRWARQATALATIVAGWVGVAAWRWFEPWVNDGAAYQPFELWWWQPGWRTLTTAAVAVVVVPLGVGWATRDRTTGPVLDSPVTVRRVPDLRRNPGLILDGFEGLGGSTTKKAFDRQRKEGTSACSWASEPMTQWAADGHTPIGLLAKVRCPEPAVEMLKGNPDEKMAAAVGRSEDLVELTKVREDPANVVTVFVSERSLADMELPWPLAKTGRRVPTANFFEAIPVLFDRMGNELGVCLNGKHGLIGGATETGKTSAASIIMAGVCLDDRVRLYAFFKIGNDGWPFQPIAHRVRAGNDAEDIQVLLGDLEEIITDAKIRGDFMDAHPHLFPKGHVTEEAWETVQADPDLLAQLGESGLDPIVLYIDECRFLFADPDVGEKLVWLCSQARAFGVFVLLATQLPDRFATPTAVKSNLLFRAALQVMGEPAQRAILGDGSGAKAYVPGELTEKGMTYAMSTEWAQRGAVKGRFYFVEKPELRSLMEDAAARRRARGRLTGMAAGIEPPDPDADTIIDHIAALPAWGDRIHGHDLAHLLGEAMPLYTGSYAEQILGMLRAAGVAVRQVETVARFGPDAGQRRNRNGIRRADFDQTHRQHIAERDQADRARRTLPTMADIFDDPPADLHPNQTDHPDEQGWT